MKNPTEPGFYWYYRDGRWVVEEVLRVPFGDPDLGVFCKKDGYTRLHNLSGRWGPRLEPPNDLDAGAPPTPVDVEQEVADRG